MTATDKPNFESVLDAARARIQEHNDMLYAKFGGGIPVNPKGFIKKVQQAGAQSLDDLRCLTVADMYTLGIPSEAFILAVVVHGILTQTPAPTKGVENNPVVTDKPDPAKSSST